MVMFTKSPLNRMSYKALVLGCFSGLAFLGAGFLISGSVIINNNNASAASDSAETPINIEVNDVISIATGGSIDVSAEPNKFSSASTTLTVSTNSPYGYTMTMAVGGADNTLHHVDATSSSADTTITSLSSNSSAANFPAGKWGYLIGNATNYSSIPAAGSSTTITEAGSTGTETTTVTVGAKPTATNYGGTYTNSLIFTAITNIPPTPTISSITTMQEMTPEICDASAENESKALIDTRGPQPYESYTVKKLADGKCWMTENLRLGGSSTINLTSSNTNITDPFTLPASSTDKFSNDSTSYTTAGINTSKKDTVQPASDFSPAGKIGVFYNYCAASAGTYCAASGSGSGNAEHDICPKGWRMPTGGSSGEYQALYTAYSSNVANFQSALVTPLSGVFYDGSTLSQGSFGYFWSSTRYGGNNMYSLYVNSSGVGPANNCSRYYGTSVRCVAQ